MIRVPYLELTRNHHMMRWTFPISVGYISPPGEVKFAEQYDCKAAITWSVDIFSTPTGTGTIDYAAFLSVNPGMTSPVINIHYPSLILNSTGLSGENRWRRQDSGLLPSTCKRRWQKDGRGARDRIARWTRPIHRQHGLYLSCVNYCTVDWGFLIRSTCCSRSQRMSWRNTQLR